MVNFETSSIDRWYCIHTAPAHEISAAEYLRSKNVSVYYPILPQRSRCVEKKGPAPLFPRYLFARFSLNSYDAVRHGQGVAAVVSGMSGPLPVPDEVIEEIQDRLSRGFYRGPNLHTGQRVTVQSGAFKGVTGIFKAYTSGRERVRILMELMSRIVVVEVDCRQVDKCPGGRDHQVSARQAL